MAGEATGLVIFAMRSVIEEIRGPASSRLWRPGFCCTLIEKHLPMWVITPIGYAAHDEPKHLVVVCNENIEGPLEMDLMPTMASIFDPSNAQLKAQADREGLIHSSGSNWWIAPVTKYLGVDNEYEGEEVIERYEEIQTDYPSGKLYEMSFKVIADRCRVTSMKLPDSSLNQNNSILWMRSLGIDVDEFSLVIRVQQ
jgi:hypothetical protein